MHQGTHKDAHTYVCTYVYRNEQFDLTDNLKCLY